jgi:hypothetical protein
MKLSASLIFVATLGSIGVVAAQQEFKSSPNPVSDAVRDNLARNSKNLVASAELMPAEKYGYQPTPAQMTFGQLIAHVVQTNVALCSGISGTTAPMTPEELKKLAGTDPKDALVGAIKRSFEYCTEALSRVNDAQLADEATMFGRRTGQSRGMMLVTIANDWADHYSTAAGYLRLNGLLPPTAQPRK